MKIGFFPPGCDFKAQSVRTSHKQKRRVGADLLALILSRTKRGNLYAGFLHKSHKGLWYCITKGRFYKDTQQMSRNE